MVFHKTYLLLLGGFLRSLPQAWGAGPPEQPLYRKAQAQQLPIRSLRCIQFQPDRKPGVRQSHRKAHYGYACHCHWASVVRVDGERREFPAVKFHFSVLSNRARRQYRRGEDNRRDVVRAEVIAVTILNSG